MSEKQGPKMKPKGNYPGNSISSRSAGVSVKPSLLSTIIRGFIPNFDRLDMNTLLSEIIIPYIKDAFWNSLGAVMYDGAAPTRRVNGTVISGNQQTNYNRISNNAQQTMQTTVQKQRFEDYRDIVLRPIDGESAADVRARAEDIIMDIRNQVDVYGRASIVYLFTLFDITRDNPQENNWGWDRRNVGQISCMATGEAGCYRMYFPKAVDISGWDQ